MPDACKFLCASFTEAVRRLRHVGLDRICLPSGDGAEGGLRAAGSLQARQSLRLPGSGFPTATRVSTLMTT